MEKSLFFVFVQRSVVFLGPVQNKNCLEEENVRLSSTLGKRRDTEALCEARIIVRSHRKESQIGALKRRAFPGFDEEEAPVTPAKERRRKRTWWCRLFSFPRDFCAFWNATRGDAESRESVVVLAASIVIDFSYKKKWVLMRR